MEGGGGQEKEAVHKCHSDPGGGVPPAGPSRRLRSISGHPSRKCVLTLDGYSYVIGETENVFDANRNKYITIMFLELKYVYVK